MQTLSQFSPQPLEVYSLDEAWLDCSSIPQAGQLAFAQDRRQTLDRWVGIPVSIGLGRPRF